MDNKIPDYMEPTVRLLRCAYPEQIPAPEVPALMAILREAGMSIRSVAAAFGYYHARPDVEFYSDANMSIVDSDKSPEIKTAVLSKLRQCGLDQVLPTDEG